MQGSQKVIDALNDGLTIELTAINQYFVQSKMCLNWGLNKLAAKHYEESIGEMKHAEQLIDRIIFLEGTPEIARYDVIRVGESVKEQFENDLVLETNGVNATTRRSHSALGKTTGAAGTCWRRFLSNRKSTSTGSNRNST